MPTGGANELDKVQLVQQNRKSPFHVKHILDDGEAMKEINEVEKESWNYILFRRGSDLIISVISGGVGIYETTVRLNNEDVDNYKSNGKSFLEDLANEIRLNPSRFEERFEVLPKPSSKL